MTHLFFRGMALAVSVSLLSAAISAGTAVAQPRSASPAPALQQEIEAVLRAVGPGTRFGIVVADENGREIVALAPESRFVPASNTKMFTTAAAFSTLAGLDGPDLTGGAAVRLERRRGGAPDVVLVGQGDARLSSAADCVVDCLSILADAVAAKTRTVGNVIGDDSLFPDQRWSPGMSWNNIPTRSGTAASALSLDDNELTLTVTAAAAGETPRIQIPAYYSVDNRALTAPGETSLSIDRIPGSRLVRLSGTIAPGGQPETLRLGVDDPADYAAWRLRLLLEARGVRVKGAVSARHRPVAPSDDPASRKGAVSPRSAPAEVLARLTPPPLAEDLRQINKVSQNLHAELMLRRIGLNAGTGSLGDGLAAVRAMLASAGVPRAQYDLSDGSGMSTYNRLSPRGVVTFLRWVRAQPWGAAWRETLPVAGVDGTLARRFRGTPLEGRLFAKTGSLNGATALSGYMTGRSGRTLIFSAFANDMPEGVSATAAIDRALELVARRN